MFDSQALAALGVDAEAGLAYCAGDPEFYAEMLGEYAAEARVGLDELERFYAGQDWQRYGIRAHLIKSTSRMIGATAFSELARALEFAAREDKFVAAICAAPQVLAKAGVATGKRVTSYPGANFQAMFQDAEYVDDNTMTEDGVIVCGNMITSRGPGTTLPFAYRLVEMLDGPAETLREAMQYNALKASVRAH